MHGVSICSWSAQQEFKLTSARSSSIPITPHITHRTPALPAELPMNHQVDRPLPHTSNPTPHFHTTIGHTCCAAEVVTLLIVVILILLIKVVVLGSPATAPPVKRGSSDPTAAFLKGLQGLGFRV